MRRLFEKFITMVIMVENFGGGKNYIEQKDQGEKGFDANLLLDAFYRNKFFCNI